MLLPLLALDLLLSVMADSVKAIHALLANEFLSGNFAVGVVNLLERIKRRLAATFGRNLPVTNSDLMIARLVFGVADVVTRSDASSQLIKDIYVLCVELRGRSHNRSYVRSKLQCEWIE